MSFQWSGNVVFVCSLLVQCLFQAAAAAESYWMPKEVHSAHWKKMESEWGIQFDGATVEDDDEEQN